MDDRAVAAVRSPPELGKHDAHVAGEWTAGIEAVRLDAQDACRAARPSRAARSIGAVEVSKHRALVVAGAPEARR